MVRQARPAAQAQLRRQGVALRHKLAHAAQATGIDVVELREGQTRRVGVATAALAFAVQAAVGHQLVQLLAPVVEVACDQQRCVGRNFAFNKLLQALNLPHAAGRDQAQMHHDHMHMLAQHVHHRVQEAALLEAVV